jgi:hypothetical protein
MQPKRLAGSSRARENPQIEPLKPPKHTNPAQTGAIEPRKGRHLLRGDEARVRVRVVRREHGRPGGRLLVLLVVLHEERLLHHLLLLLLRRRRLLHKLLHGDRSPARLPGQGDRLLGLSGSD